jgi:CRP-like cAMP-binding protein
MLAQATTHIDPSRPVISTHHVSAAVSKQNPLIEAMHMMGATTSFPSETEIFGEGEGADYAYQIVSGGVRTYKILKDGRRQVGGFYVPGDIFGLEYRLSAEAITDTKVVVVKRSMLMALAGRDPVIARELLAVTGSELRRVQTRMLLLVKRAEERVAGFLLEMAERTRSGNVVELPMTRRDIAEPGVDVTAVKLGASELGELTSCFPTWKWPRHGGLKVYLSKDNLNFRSITRETRKARQWP